METDDTGKTNTQEPVEQPNPNACGACNKTISKEEHERYGGFCESCVAAAAKKAQSESWQMMPLSGIIPGVVMAVSRANMEGGSWILVTGFAYAFCITNKNFCYGWAQRIIATAIMFVIGFYGMDILDLMLQPE